MSESTYRLGYGDYLRFRELVHERSGLHFPEKKRTDLENGVSKALRDTAVPINDIANYYQFLRDAATPQAKAEMNRLINLLTIGETHFFRDESQFDALAKSVLPDLIRRKRAAAAAANLGAPGGVPQLRIWSAGCASGEEPYSLAILLRELIPDIDKWRILILGTDINQESLNRARQGLYSNWSFRETRALAMRALYFQREEKNRYRLKDQIREMVTFSRHNLIENPFPAVYNNIVSMDLIMCRNVTIYFAQETTRQLVKQFYETLVDGGWLVVGHSEPSMLIYRDFQIKSFPGAILYQKTGEPTAMPQDWATLHETPPPDKTAPPPPQTAPVAPPAPPPAKVTHTTPPPPDPMQQVRRAVENGRLDAAALILEDEAARFDNGQQAAAACLLARAYADGGDWAAARRWSRLALQKDRLRPDAYFVLAMVEEQTGNEAEAIANLKRVIYLDGQRPLAHFHLAMLYRKTGDPAQAARSLQNSDRILSTRNSDEIIADSGGATVRRLRRTIQQLLANETAPAER